MVGYPLTTHWFDPSNSESWIASPRKAIDCFFRGPRRELIFQKIELPPRMNEMNGVFGEGMRVNCIPGAESGAVAVAGWISWSSRATSTRVRVV